MDIYNNLKQLTLDHGHIISIQMIKQRYLHLDVMEFQYVNIQESIPIWIQCEEGDYYQMLECIDNKIDINKARQDLIQKILYQKINHNFKDLYTDDSELYLLICACLYFIDVNNITSGSKFNIKTREKLLLTKQDVIPPSNIFQFDKEILSLFRNDINYLIQQIHDNVLGLEAKDWNLIEPRQIKLSRTTKKSRRACDLEFSVAIKYLFLNLKNLI